MPGKGRGNRKKVPGHDHSDSATIPFVLLQSREKQAMMSSLFIGTTGLKTLEQNMGVISNNLANVNTVAYKTTKMEFQDLMSQLQMSRSNMITNLSQVGMGANTLLNRTNFRNGAFEAGSAVTDIGIQGIGFFGVQNEAGLVEYTRAGNFRFDKDGRLLDPEGWNLLGYKISNGVTASQPTPINLDLSSTTGYGMLAARQSSALTAIMQLGKIEDRNNGAVNPFFGLAASYDATVSPPLSANAYSHAQPLDFYDAKGNLHQMIMYVDLAQTSSGRTAMEYVIAMPPEVTTDPVTGLPVTPTEKGAGLFMAGTLTFDSSGQIQNITAFTPGGDPADLAAWTAAPMNNGNPVIRVSVPGGGSQNMTLDLGFAQPNGPAGSPATAADLAADPSLVFGIATGGIQAPSSTTMRSASNGCLIQQTDGYPEGELRSIEITREGKVVANYTNSQNLDLYTIPLYRFTSQDGLIRQGGNHYAASPDAGNISHGVPGSENYGVLSSWSLEMSNVDYANEFAELIITQRGFQANSKVITTSDAMLQKAVEIKRN